MNENYKEGIPRVSEIVSYVFPFSGGNHYSEWLKQYGITPEEYLEKSQELGTLLHLFAEQYINNRELPIIPPLLEEEKNGIINYIDGLRKEFPDIIWETEKYLRDKDNKVQGTLDLLRVNKQKEAWLYDYKSFEVVKKYFNIPGDKLTKTGVKKPTDKLKKLSLQLSIYAYILTQLGYKIKGGYLSWIYKDKVYEFKVELRDFKDIEDLLSEFHKRQYYITF